MPTPILRSLAILIVTVPGAFAQAGNDLNALLEKGRAALEQARFPEATDAFTNAVVLDPLSFEAHLELAQAFLAQAPPNLLVCGDTGWQADVAEKEIEEALRLSPHASDALTTMGNIAYRKGMFETDTARRRIQFQRATESYEKALAGDSRNSEAHAGLAEIAAMDLMDNLGQVLTHAHMWMGIKRPLGPNGITPEDRKEYRKEADSGIQHASMAFELDPHSSRAFDALALLMDSRAYIEETDEAFARDRQAGSDWTQRAVAERRLHSHPVQSRRPCEVGGFLGGVLGGLPAPPPPR
jgi:tetratricopeptide (TPR) repeat protein